MEAGMASVRYTVHFSFGSVGVSGFRSATGLAAPYLIL